MAFLSPDDHDDSGNDGDGGNYQEAIADLLHRDVNIHAVKAKDQIGDSDKHSSDSKSLHDRVERVVGHGAIGITNTGNAPSVRITNTNILLSGQDGVGNIVAIAAGQGDRSVGLNTLQERC